MGRRAQVFSSKLLSDPGLKLIVKQGNLENRSHPRTDLFGNPVFDRKTKVLRVEGVFAEPGAPKSAGSGIASATRRLAKWLGAEEILYSRRVPAAWRASLRT